MSDWGTAFLGVIALATLAIAVVQVYVIVLGLRALRRLDSLSERARDELLPLAAGLDAVTREAQHALSVATETLYTVQSSVQQVARRVDQPLASWSPASRWRWRAGAALLAGARAVLRAFEEATTAHPAACPTRRLAADLVRPRAARGRAVFALASGFAVPTFARPAFVPRSYPRLCRNRSIRLMTSA